MKKKRVAAAARLAAAVLTVYCLARAGNLEQPRASAPTTNSLDLILSPTSPSGTTRGMVAMQDRGERKLITADSLGNVLTASEKNRATEDAPAPRVFSVAEVSALHFLDHTTLVWTPVTSDGVTYDVLRGTLLPVGSNPSDETCVARFYSELSITISTAPTTGSIHWYLVRAHDQSGAAGPWGFQSNGTPRISDTCGSSCTPDGGACASLVECCSGSCNAGLCGPPPCVSDGGACASLEDCCSGLCNGNVCCRPPGAVCSTDVECCTAPCNGGICAGGCTPDGTVCASPGDCCSGLCNAGLCGPPPCAPDGGACAGFEDCCSGFCNGSVCCRPPGAVCSTDVECCTGPCSGGTCAGGCTPDGGACTSPGDCCSELCNAGFCGPQP